MNDDVVALVSVLVRYNHQSYFWIDDDIDGDDESHVDQVFASGTWIFSSLFLDVVMD